MREYMRNYRAHHDYNEYIRRYYADPEHRKHRRAVVRARFASHPEALQKKRSQHTRYMRENYIGTIIDGKRTYVRAPGKRGKPDKCELCGRGTAALAYHHWDDLEPGKGLWLCNPCHVFAEWADRGMLRKYIERREEVEKQFAATIAAS